jgi:signal transduction histidine kinase
MKKKIYFGLFCLILCFLAGGLYLGTSIDKVTKQLEKIIVLNKVQFLRENLLNKVVLVQSDLMLKDTPHSRKVDIFVKHVEEMHQASNHCLNCHHEEPTRQRIVHFETKIDMYMKQLSRVYTLRANDARLKKEKQNAFDIGQDALDEINSIIIASSHTTSQRILQARQNIEKSKEFLFGLMIIGPLIILFTTFYFFRNFTRSVTSLTKATREIKAGDLSYRIKDQLKDEFRELATSFNEMAFSLTEQRIKIKRAERLAAVGELAAGLAHEVKNPLAGIKVSIEVLKNDLHMEQEDREIFLRIINEINRIESLLKNLLNYARPSKPQPLSVNIHEILGSIIKTSEFSLKSPKESFRMTKDINFTRDFDSDIPNIFIDPGQLQQVFLNLTLNATDAITDQGTINIKTVRATDESFEIRISDTGHGIDVEPLDMVFNPFYTSKSKGTGLGLSICKRLIEQQNGSISVFNNPEGGATFVITLPVKHANEKYEAVK